MTLTVSRTGTAVAVTVTLGLAGVVAPAAPAIAAGATSCSGVLSSTVTPSTLVDGDGARQTIVLTRPAPPGGLFVDLRGSNDYYSRFSGGGVRLEAGATRITIPVRFSGSSRTIVVDDLTASVGSCGPTVGTNRVTVRPLDPDVLAVRDVVFDRRQAITGETVRATVRLTGPARPTGTTVRLYGGPYGGNGLSGGPLSPTVPAGQSSVSFPVRVVAVAPGTAGLSAQTGTSSGGGDLLAFPDVLALNAGLDYYGPVSRVLLGLGTVAPAGGARVTLSSTRSGITVPASVTVPAGSRGVYVPVTVADSVDRAYGGGHLVAAWQGQRVRAQIYFY